jgi:glycosyltransferase involved in cell wall biosynthesis
MKSAYVNIQPSLIEGLSPVILTVMGLGTPLLCSDIAENTYITDKNATHFESGNAEDLADKIIFTLNNSVIIKEQAESGRQDVLKRFNWNSITDQYINLFLN